MPKAQYEMDVSRATGLNEVTDDVASNLNSVVQLTGKFENSHTARA